MPAKTKRKKRYLDKKDSSKLYMKEYRESNGNEIRESQKQFYSSVLGCDIFWGVYHLCRSISY